MKITQARITRYLKKVKKINDYLLKVHSKDRYKILKLQKARTKLIEGEQELRELNEYLAEENF